MDPASVLTVDHIAHNPSFNQANPIISLTPSGGGALDVAVALLEPTGVQPEQIGSGEVQILLGTITITAGAKIGSVTNFRIQDNSDLFDSTVTFDGPTALDSDIQPFDLSLTVVPEPMTIAVFLAMTASIIATHRGNQSF